MTWSPPPPVRERYWLHALLLGLTLVTTTWTGAMQWLSFQMDFGNVVPRVSLIALALDGLWYGLTILAILGAHELGHYLACRYYGISASLPYFIPLPPLIAMTGTAGAFIRIRQPITTKRALFDIGIAGPLAGFVVAVPALFLGLTLSRVVELPPNLNGMFELGEPLLFKAAAWLVWGPLPDHQSINLHPMAFAAWFGLLATALNLLPIGQLDGGHLAYAVFGRNSIWVTRITLAALTSLVIYTSVLLASYSLAVFTAIAAALLFRFGWHHPPTWDEHEPLDQTRLAFAVLALVIFVVCFTPLPLTLIETVQPK